MPQNEWPVPICEWAHTFELNWYKSHAVFLWTQNIPKLLCKYTCMMHWLDPTLWLFVASWPYQRVWKLLTIGYDVADWSGTVLVALAHDLFGLPLATCFAFTRIEAFANELAFLAEISLIKASGWEWVDVSGLIFNRFLRSRNVSWKHGYMQMYGVSLDSFVLGAVDTPFCDGFEEGHF